MALNYLLCPTFQVINTGGKPATGGYIECYIHGTRDKYYCYSDWEGTLHPFQIPLDSLGANIVLADEQNSYDVYIYNRYGSLLMSRYKVKPSGGGGIASITSSDGSINVNYTENGIDLTLADDKASCLKAGAQNLSADGIFSWFKKESVGESIHCDQGFIVLDDGWYHFTATVRLDWRQIPVNETGRITLSTTLTSDVMEFDYSFAHDETFELSGDIYIAPSSTQYIQSGRGFVLSVMGMKTGMVAEMVGLDIHTIVGQGTGGEKNIHRLLRWYTNASEADEQHPAGDWLHDLDSEDPDDPSGHPMVTADQLFAWYDAGQNFELYEVDGNNGQLGWSAIYRMVTWQDQSDWWSQFAPTPGKACRLEFFRMGMYSTPYRGGLIAYIRYKDEDYMRLYEIMPGQSIWMAEYQPKLPYYASNWHAGDFLRVKQDGSDLEWVPLSGVALSGSYNDLSDVPTDLVQDEDYVHTDNNFTDSDKSKLDCIESGAQVNVQSDWAESDSSSDSYIQNKPDLSEYATDAELSAGLETKQDTLTAGNNITIQNNVISATAAPQEQSDWTETDSSDVSFIKHKPTVKPVVAGSNITITEGADSFVISADGSGTQVQSDWTETDTEDPSYIQHKPDLSIYAETANLATVATTGSYDDLSDKPTIPQAQVNSDWNASSGVAEILNKPNLSTVATTGDYNDLSNRPSIPAAQVNADWTASSGVAEILHKPTLAAVATSGDYADLSNTPSIPTATSDLTNDTGYITLSDVPAQVQSDWTESDTTNPAYIQNKPDLSVYATGSELTAGLATKQDTISDLATIRSGASDGATAVQPGDLATVATSGDYDDLSNKPTIPSGPQLVPSATSADANKVLKVNSVGTPEWSTGGGGGGVNADWDETDPLEPSYIENKPTPKTLTAGTGISIADGVSTVTISSTVTIPVQDVTVDGNSVVSNGVAAITSPTVDQTYDASSTNAQSGVAVAGAISAAVIPISVVSTLPANPDPNTLYIVTGA